MQFIVRVILLTIFAYIVGIWLLLVGGVLWVLSEIANRK